MSESSPTVFIVDDDASVLRSLSRLVGQANYEARAFSSAEEFLKSCSAPFTRPACLILDLRMPGLGGLELQSELVSNPVACPIIFISGNVDIPSTVRAMKQGAVTFLAKPFDHADLLRAIEEAHDRHRQLLADAARVESVHQRIRRLTPREREVMAWVITGALNKQIADHLGIVEKTVKIHRGRAMEKMQVVSVADLVRLCDAAGFEAARAN